ncbi:hypothetical protein [Thioclava sp. GXIMD4216]|uniref:hypothetical protein n=1 Tax=Thioclava sp. GXIMD4216 TaxID=3131929 RepID=UPI0030CB3350
MNLIFVMEVLSGHCAMPSSRDLQEGNIGKNPAGFALGDAESAFGRQRRRPKQSDAKAHKRLQIRKNVKPLLKKDFAD